MADPSQGDQNDQDPDVFRERFATVGPFRAPRAYTPQQSVLKYAPTDITRKHPHIARGTYGVVFKGNVKGIANEVVIKDMEILDQISVDEWQREIQIMARTKSQYVAEVFGYSNESTILTIIMELMENGDLFGILHKHPEKHPLSLIQRMRMSRHCCLGLKVLHDNKIIHRDIKSMNILVNYDYVCKLTDFGCSKLVQTTASYMQTAHQGTPLWMAPEVKSGNYGMSSDVYSMGLVLYEIFEKKLPNFDPETKITTVPKQFGSAPVVLPCIKKNPEDRPKIDAVISLIGNLIRRIIASIKNRLSEELLAKICCNLGDDSKDVDEEEFFALYSYLVNLPTKEADEIINGALQKPSGNATPSQQTPTATPQQTPNANANAQNPNQQQPAQPQQGQGGQNQPNNNNPLRKSNSSGQLHQNKIVNAQNQNAQPAPNNNQQQAPNNAQASPQQPANNAQNQQGNNQQQPSASGQPGQGFQRPSGARPGQPQPQLLRPSGRGQNVGGQGQPQPQLLRPSSGVKPANLPPQQPQVSEEEQARLAQEQQLADQQRALEEQQRQIEEKQRELEEQRRALEEQQQLAQQQQMQANSARLVPNPNPNSQRVAPNPNPNVVGRMSPLPNQNVGSNPANQPGGNSRPIPTANPNVGGNNGNPNSPPNNQGGVPLNRPSNQGGFVRPGSGNPLSNSGNSLPQSTQQQGGQISPQANPQPQQTSPQNANPSANPNNAQGNPNQQGRPSARGQPIKVLKVVPTQGGNQQGGQPIQGQPYQQRAPMGGGQPVFQPGGRPSGIGARNPTMGSGQQANQVSGNGGSLSESGGADLTKSHSVGADNSLGGSGGGGVQYVDANGNPISNQGNPNQQPLSPSSSRDHMGRRRSRSCGPAPTTGQSGLIGNNASGAQDDNTIQHNNNAQGTPNGQYNNNPNTGGNPGQNPQGNPQGGMNRSSIVKKVVVGPNGVPVQQGSPQQGNMQRGMSVNNLNNNVVQRPSNGGPNIAPLNLNQPNPNNNPNAQGALSPRKMEPGQTIVTQGGQKVIVQRSSKVQGQPGQPGQPVMMRPVVRPLSGGRDQHVLEHNNISPRQQPNNLVEGQ